MLTATLRSVRFHGAHSVSPLYGITWSPPLYGKTCSSQYGITWSPLLYGKTCSPLLYGKTCSPLYGKPSSLTLWNNPLTLYGVTCSVRNEPLTTVRNDLLFLPACSRLSPRSGMGEVEKRWTKITNPFLFRRRKPRFPPWNAPCTTTA